MQFELDFHGVGQCDEGDSVERIGSIDTAGTRQPIYRGRFKRHSFTTDGSVTKPYVQRPAMVNSVHKIITLLTELATEGAVAPGRCGELEIA